MIKIFTTPSCSHSILLKQTLNSIHKEYIEIDISSLEGFTELSVKCPDEMRLPIVEIGGKKIDW